MTFQSGEERGSGWTTLATETHFESAHLRVTTEEVRTPASDRIRHWTVAHRKAAVVIAPMTRRGELVLIRQERIPIRAAIWEVPAGQIDDPEEPQIAAIEAVGLRELREEAGYELAPDGEMIPLGEFYSSPGFTDEHSYFFLARGVQPAAEGHAHQDSESILDCRAFAPDQLAQMIRQDEIRDANTLGVCAKLAARGFLTLSP